MPFRCPNCRLPLSASEASAAQCPVCRKELGRSATGRGEKAPAPQVLPTTEASALNVLGIWAVILVLGLGAGGTLFYVLMARMGGGAPAPLARPEPASRAAGGTVLMAAAWAGEKADDKSAASQPSSVVPTLSPGLSAGSGKPPAPLEPGRDLPPPAPPAADPSKDDPPPGEADQAPYEIVVLEKGKKGTLENLGKNRRVRVTGSSYRFDVPSVSDSAVLDLTMIDVRSFQIKGDLDGQAVVRINSPKGKVSILGSIGGNARLEIHVPNGEVEARESCVISGSAKLRIVAREVHLNKLSGGADVKLTLTKGAELSFRKMEQGATLRYRLDESAGSEVNLQQGEVRDGAKLIKE